MAKNQWVAAAANIALIMTVLGAAWLTVGELGVGETWDVVSGDTANLTAETNATFGGTPASGGNAVGFSDRVVTAGAALSLLVGLGALGVSSSNPKVFNDIIRYLPLFVGVLGLIEFSSIASDFIGGSYDFDVYTDGQNALHIFVIGAIIGAVAKLMGMRR